jgi:hypothetical protein
MLCEPKVWSPSVLPVRSGGGRVTELVGLVGHVRRDLAELVTVLACVMGAEQQLTTRLELDPKVGLSSATVAAVRSAERGTRGNSSGHNGLISFFVGAGSNVVGEAKIPSIPPRPTCRPTPDPITALVPVRSDFHSPEYLPVTGDLVLSSVTVPALSWFEIPEITDPIVSKS